MDSNVEEAGANGTEEKKDRFRVYVANLPPKATSAMLEEEFSKCAKVIGVLIPKNAKYAFVDFATLEEAEKAVADMQQHMMNGSALRVEMGKGEPRVSAGGEKGERKRTTRTRNRVVVSGLSAGSSWQDLKDIMRETGGDVTFTSIKDSVGYAEFATESDVDRAIEKLDGNEIRGARLSVKRDEVAERDLERDHPPQGKRDGRRRRDDRRRRQRSRSPRRQRGRSRERRRSRSRRSPDNSRRRRDRDDKDRDSRRRRDSDSSRSRSPRRRQRTRSG